MMDERVKGIYEAVVHSFIRKTFLFWQRLGVHVVFNNFCEPIPDTRRLKNDLWSRHSELTGIDINEARQTELLTFFVSRFKKEYEGFPKDKTFVPYEYYIRNSSFESVDGEILYCMIRHFKPKRIFEIGSGFSTLLSAQAILKNKEEKDGSGCELVAIEPYPNDFLKVGFPGLATLIPKEVQDIPLSEFKRLAADDILFIDSSHILKMGSDLHYLFLEVLPRLNQGVLVHIHDIFLPAEYLKEWIFKDYKFYNEQYLLQAFLAFNNHFEVLWAASYMHLRHPDKLEMAFSSYTRDKEWPGSFWIRKVH